MISRRRFVHGCTGAAFVLGASRWNATRGAHTRPGVHWVRRFGETADLTGGDRGDTRFVAGVRVWF